MNITATFVLHLVGERGNWGSEKLSNLVQVTQPARSRAEICLGKADTQGYALNQNGSARSFYDSSPPKLLTPRCVNTDTTRTLLTSNDFHPARSTSTALHFPFRPISAPDPPYQGHWFTSHFPTSSDLTSQQQQGKRSSRESPSPFGCQRWLYLNPPNLV